MASLNESNKNFNIQPKTILTPAERLLGNKRARKVLAEFTAGALVLTGGALAIKKGSEQASQQNRRDSVSYQGKYHLPTAKEAHLSILVGDTRHGEKLTTIDSIRDYIHERNPAISADEAADLLLAENSHDQLEAGVQPSNVDPTRLQLNQEIRLPLGYGVGDYQPGTKGSSGK